MTGAALTVKCLLEQGVRDIFGYPGASVLPLFEAAESEKKLSLYVNTDEKFCAFAANGYSRASGRTGVCIATSGPGATNLVTAVADAYMDSIPLVAVTGNVPLRLRIPAWSESASLFAARIASDTPVRFCEMES